MMLLSGILVCFAGTSLLPAQEARERIERGKASTAFVDLSDGKSSATAVCINAKGTFVTNYHVVKGVAKEATIKLVLDPNAEKRRELKALVVRTDEAADLAVLQIQGEEKGFVFLPLGDDSKLFETMSVTAFGFPFGKKLAGKDEKYPDISISVGRITSLRKQEGKLDRIQLDAQLNPGDSGGPVLDEAGQIVGIVQSGVFATGVNFAIPVSRLRVMLEKPELVFQPATIAAAKRHDEVELVFSVIPFQRTLEKASVELELTSEGRPARKFTAKALGKDRYSVKVVPIPAPAATEPVWLAGTATFAKGKVEGTFLDKEVKVGGTPIKLSEIKTIDRSQEPFVVCHDNSKINGKLEGLETIAMDLGDYKLGLDLSRAQRLDLRSLARSEPHVEYSLAVRVGAEELIRKKGILPVAGTAGGRSASGPDKLTPYQGEAKTVEVPDSISDVALAGAGRFVLLHLKKTRKVAVYDVEQAKIAKFLSLGAENAFIAGGLDKMIVVSPSESVIERWSLTTFERETARPLPVEGVVKSIALGYASTGPLLIHWAVSTDALAAAKYEFFDLEKFEKLGFQNARGHNSSYRDAVHIRASGTGDVFGLWATSHSPQGMETWVLTGNTAKVSYQHDSAGHIVPNFDGSAILTGFAGVCSPELNKKGERGADRIPLMPSTHPRFYLSVPAEPGAQINLGGKPFSGRKAALHTISGESKLVDLPDLELGTAKDNASWTASDFSLDKRVVYVLQASQLISIPFSNDRLLVKRFDLRETLDKAALDYLFVTSLPPRTFKKGASYDHTFEVASRAGGLQFELSSGPAGMSISPAGVLHWNVPDDFAETKVNVIVTIKNGAGQSLFETISIVAN